MTINKNDILTLSDNIKYLVVSKIEYENKIYLYLVDLINNHNIKIVENIDDDIIQVKDKKILDRILKEIVVDLK